MKCPFCAEEINDAAIICRHCRKKLRKSPALAAFLNFFFWGAGYLYCGRQWGIAILIPFILIILYQLTTAASESPTDLSSFFIANIPGFLMAWHAYKMAESYGPQSKTGSTRDTRRLEEEQNTRERLEEQIAREERRKRRVQLAIRLYLNRPLRIVVLTMIITLVTFGIIAGGYLLFYKLFYK